MAAHLSFHSKIFHWGKFLSTALILHLLSISAEDEFIILFHTHNYSFVCLFQFPSSFPCHKDLFYSWEKRYKAEAHLPMMHLTFYKNSFTCQILTAIYYYCTKDTERVVICSCTNMEREDKKCLKLHSNIERKLMRKVISRSRNKRQRYSNQPMQINTS